MTPSGIATGFSTPSADLDLIKIGEARKSLVGVKLDQVMVNSHCIATHYGETRMSEHGCVLKPRHFTKPFTTNKVCGFNVTREFSELTDGNSANFVYMLVV